MNTFVTPLPSTGTAGTPGLAALARGGLAGVGRALWRAMQESGRARARAELLSLADAHERTQPNFARELRCAAGYDPIA